MRSLAEAKKRHQAYYREMISNDARSNWMTIDQNYTQIQHAWSSLPIDDALIDWIFLLSEYQLNRGLIKAGIEWAERGFSATDDELIHGKLHNTVGLAQTMLGQRDNALTAYQRSLHIKQQADDKKGIALTLLNIGRLYRETGQVEKALKLYEQVHEIHQSYSCLSENKLGTLHNNLGLCYIEQRQFDKAKVELDKAVYLLEKSHDLIELALAYNNLGMFYRHTNDIDSAIQYYQYALQLRKQLGDAEGTAQTLNNLATAYGYLGQFSKVQTLLEEAAGIQERIGAFYGLAHTHFNLAVLYWNTQSFDDGITEMQRAIQLLEQVNSPNAEKARAELANMMAYIANI